ncbi:holin [Gordonia phage Gsput1]|uniref:Holin n=1 Tax=Gordonia phage Gsput1 TaxID=1622193 RepID=A0A0E3XA12_9CAUD|nr:holin [Gordonia phage Gsput1]AKC03047.1 holin [Gordonia phage Gsput1]
MVKGGSGMNPTQVNHGARATVRTVFAVLVAVATLVPYVLAEAHVDATVLGAQAIAVAGAVTRIMALPQVNDFIVRFVPWLAAEPSE